MLELAFIFCLLFVFILNKCFVLWIKKEVDLALFYVICDVTMTDLMGWKAVLGLSLALLG